MPSASVLTEYGRADVLESQAVPMPEPCAGQMRIHNAR